MSPSSIAAHPAWRRRGVVGLAVAIVLLASALWLTRAPLVARVAEHVLASKGLGPADVEVRELTLTHARLALRHSALGHIDDIHIDYHWALRGGLAVERVRLRSAQLRLAWRDGTLVPALIGSTGTDTPPAPLAVELDAIHLQLHLGATLLEAEMRGTLTTGPSPSARLTIIVRGAQGELQGSLLAASDEVGITHATLALQDGDIAFATIKVQGLHGELHGTLGARGVEQLQGQLTLRQLVTTGHTWGKGTLTLAQASPTTVSLHIDSAPLRASLLTDLPMAPAPHAIALDARLDARMLAALWPAARAGAGELALRLTGEVPAMPVTLAGGLASGRLEAHADFKASEVAVADGATVDRMHAGLDCALKGGALTCTSDEGAGFEGVALPPSQRSAAGLLVGPWSWHLEGIKDAPLLTLARKDGATQLAAHAALSLNSPTLAVHAPFNATVSLTADGRAGRYALSTAIAAERPPGQPWLAPAVTLAGAFGLDATRHLQSATLDDGALTLPAQGWSARGVRADYSAGRRLDVDIGELRSSRAPALLAPLTAHLRANLARDPLSFDGTLSDASHVLEVRLSGQHGVPSGKGAATLVMKPLVLDGMDSLRAVTPALAARVSDAHGEIRADAAVHWGEHAPPGQLSLTLKDLAFSTPAFKLSALNAALALDSLAPLHSVAGQRLDAMLELPVLKRVPFSLRFNVGQQQVKVEQARAEVFDGAFEVHDGAVDIATGATRLALEVKDVDLAAAFTVLNLEQMKGSGRLSGRLPLEFKGGHIAVTDGQLETSGPGVVQIGASAVTDQLKSYGKDVDLAFRALSDFHYQSLTIAADKPLLGAGKALFHLEGNNPAVMEGQPFIFNVSLETDFDYLADLLLQLSGITNSALGWGASEMLKP